MNDRALTLPSASSAASFVAGDRGAAAGLMWHMICRAGLIGTGLYLAGAGKKTAPLALAGSAAIEAFVLAYAWRQKKEGGR